MHPEDRRADQEVAHRAAADAGHHREEDEGDERLLLHRREQRAGQSEDGDPRHVEKVEDRAESGGEMGGRHGSYHITSFQRKLEIHCCCSMTR